MASEETPAGRREMLLSLLRLTGLGAGTAALAVWLRSQSHPPQEAAASAARPNFTVPADPQLPEMAVIQGGEPGEMARRAVQELGGIRRFIARGDVVVIKPNVSWDRIPEQAATTNPALVGELCRLCLEAGAKRVIVTDVTINEAQRCFARSGIGAAARAAGAEIVLPAPQLFREVDLRGQTLTRWPVLEPFLNADKMINVPVAKHHSLTGASLGIKNWYGALGGLRMVLHQHIHEGLTDLAAFFRPTLTILDAWRVLRRNGPSGGSLADVDLTKTVLAGTDPVALDAWAAAAYWNLDEHTLRYLSLAAARGLGTFRFETVRTAVV